MSKITNPPKQLNISYLGILEPKTSAEINFEIAGLEAAVAEIQSRIATLKQAIAFSNLVSEENK